MDDHEDGTATVKYYLEEPGQYKIHVAFTDPGAPFVPVFVPTDTSKVKAHGHGLGHNGVRVGDSGDFTIDTLKLVRGQLMW